MAEGRYEKLFMEAMHKAGAIPYRVGGRLRAAYTDGTTDEVLDRMKDAVRKMAAHVSETLPEPDGPTKVKWRNAGLKQLDVCDEVCPEGVSLTECPVEWLVERCKRYHFDLSLAPTDPPTLLFLPNAGWELADKPVPGGVISGVKSIIPPWFAAACRNRKGEIISHLKARAAARGPGAA